MDKSLVISNEIICFKRYLPEEIFVVNKQAENMQDVTEREKTFEKAPSIGVTPKQLADSGFFWASNGLGLDGICCIFCGVILHLGSETRSISCPHDEHFKRQPYCPSLLSQHTGENTCTFCHKNSNIFTEDVKQKVMEMMSVDFTARLSKVVEMFNA